MTMRIRQRARQFKDLPRTGKSFKLSKDLWKELSLVKIETGISLQALIHHAIQRYLDEKGWTELIQPPPEIDDDEEE